MAEEKQPTPPVEFYLPGTPISDYFPFDSLRAAQVTALDAVTDAIERGLRNVVLELPTGTGKSGIAIAISRWLSQHRITKGDDYAPGSYILSTQLSLTEQYVRDFGHMGLVELRGSNNYHCACYNTDCSMGRKLRNAAKQSADRHGDEVEEKSEGEHSCDHCPYRAAKNAFKSGTMGISNFAYFLNESHYAKELPPREVLIIDEAHNIEGQIIGHADIEISTRRALSLGIAIPKKLNYNDRLAVHTWLTKAFCPLGESRVKGLKIEMGDAVTQGDLTLARKLAKEHDSLDKFMCKVRRFTLSDNIGAWLTYQGDHEAIRIKPLYATLYSEDLLLKQGALRVFMSATILNPYTYCRNLGLNTKETKFLRLASEFPAKNRPVYFKGVGSMSMNGIDKTMPRMLSAIEKLATRHKDSKGVIHCNSYKVQKAVVDYLETTGHKDRILAHSEEPGARDLIIRQHMTVPEPTILISPSATEGMDLKGDLARWQIIVKCPWPNLGDKWIKTRQQASTGWYDWLTALTILQASGRAVRSETDWAITYILDSDFDQLLARSGKLFPGWYLEGFRKFA